MNLNASASMLFWFWWRHRVMISLSLGLVFVSQLTYWTKLGFNGEQPYPFTYFLLFAGFMVCLMTAYTVFTFGHNLDLTSGRSAYPRWLHSLPARPMHLGFVPIVGMVFFLALGWCPWAYVLLEAAQATQRQGPTPTESLKFVCFPWLGMCGVGLWMQASAWWPFRSPLHRALLLFGLVFCFALLLTIGSLYPLWNQVGIPAFMGLGLVAAVLCVSKSRYRSWAADSGGSFMESIRESVSTEIGEPKLSDFDRQLNLKSETKSLAWRDWKQLSKVPIWLMGALAIVNLMSVFFFEASPNALVVLLFPALICAFVGTRLGKDQYWKGSVPMSPFLATLPISNRQMLLSRLRNVLKVSLATWAMAAGVLLVWLCRERNRELLVRIRDGCVVLSGAASGWPVLCSFILLIFCLAIFAPLPGFAIGFCGRRKMDLGFIIAMIAGGFIGSMAMGAWFNMLGADISVSDFMNDPEVKAAYWERIWNQAPWLLYGLLVAKLVWAAVPVALLLKRGIATWKAIMTFVAIWVAAVALLLGAFGLLLYDADSLFRNLVLLVVSVFIPFGVLLMMPFSLDWNRNR